VVRRRPNDKITSLGDDFRKWPREFWGTRDIAQARAEELAKAALRPTPRKFEALPGPPIPDSTLKLLDVCIVRPPRRKPQAVDEALERR
jgi:hypothetical protein